MKKSILLSLCAFFVFTACQNETNNTPQKPQISAAEIKQKDTKAINDIFKKMTDGFRNNDLSGFYDALDEKAIIIEGNGNEVYDKPNIVNHFESRTRFVKLTGWKLYELILADSLALSKADYQITYLENEKEVGKTDSNWHIVWKKDNQGNWKILREIFNEKEK